MKKIKKKCLAVFLTLLLMETAVQAEGAPDDLYALYQHP